MKRIMPTSSWKYKTTTDSKESEIHNVAKADTEEKTQESHAYKKQLQTTEGEYLHSGRCRIDGQMLEGTNSLTVRVKGNINMNFGFLCIKLKVRRKARIKS